MSDTTPGELAIDAGPGPEAPDAVRPAWREAVRWVVLLGLALVLPMILLGTTVAAHAEGCGGG